MSSDRPTAPAPAGATVTPGADERLRQRLAGLTHLELIEEIVGLTRAMRTRAPIEMAKGILMEREQLTQDQAFAVLTRLSQNSNRKVHAVAVALVRKVSPQPLTATDGPPD
jgi:hypothetical protein